MVGLERRQLRLGEGTTNFLNMLRILADLARTFYVSTFSHVSPLELLRCSSHVLVLVQCFASMATR